MLQDTFRNILYRASKKPQTDLPFGVRSVGHYRMEKGFRELGRNKNFVQLFWGVSGRGELVHDSRTYVLSPGRVFLYFKKDTHRLRALSRRWEYRWFTLDGEMNESVVRSFGLRRGGRSAGACPAELFIQLEASLRDITARGERRAAVIAFSIIAESCGTLGVVRREENAAGACASRIEKDFKNPGISISRISEELGINRAGLSRAFSRRLGMSPQQYLLSLRMQKAMSLLKETDLRVSEVAYSVGYTDPNYFARAFKKNTGMTPGDFRVR